MNATAPSLSRLFAVALALAVPVATRVAIDRAVVSTRPATFTLQSEGTWSHFGFSIAADGAVIVAVERDVYDDIVLRIERVVGDRVVPEARIPLDNWESVPGVAIRGDVAIATRNFDHVRFIERIDGTWREMQRFDLEAECHVRQVFPFVHLGEDLAVVESDTFLCIFERRAGRWAMVTTIPRDPDTTVAVSQNRVLVRNHRDVHQYTHERDGWLRTTIATAPSGLTFVDIAASDRWLLLEDDEGSLYIHDFDNGARLHSTIPGRRRDRFWIGIGPRALATTGERGAHAWTFVDNEWKDVGSLDGATSNGDAFSHPVAIGDYIWIGDPPKQHDESGWVHGFSLR